MSDDAASREKTLTALRAVLFDEINTLQAGQSEPMRAVAVAILARQIIATANVELRFHKTRLDAEQHGQTIESAFVPSATASPAVETLIASADTKEKAPIPPAPDRTARSVGTV